MVGQVSQAVRNTGLTFVEEYGTERAEIDETETEQEEEN